MKVKEATMSKKSNKWKRYSRTCRNNNGCETCNGSRQIQLIKARHFSELDLRDVYLIMNSDDNLPHDYVYQSSSDWMKWD